MKLLFDQNPSHRLQVGNCSTADIEARLRRNADELARFHLDGTSAVFIIE